jgi:hypothetical protein
LYFKIPIAGIWGALLLFETASGLFRGLFGNFPKGFGKMSKLFGVFPNKCRRKVVGGSKVEGEGVRQKAEGEMWGVSNFNHREHKVDSRRTRRRE